MIDPQTWARRLADARGRSVIFLAHCLLNENTRYLGGACRPGAIPEIVEPCLRAGIGIVQLSCPEQLAWGGVGKRRLLWLYGAQSRLVTPVRRLLMPLMLWYTRRVYRRLAADAAGHMRDYRDAGCTVLGVIGVDGSPSCGVCRTLDVRRAVEELARLRPETATAEGVTAIVKHAACSGPGLFTRLLRKAMIDRGMEVRIEAHDLIRELEGQPLGNPVASLLAASSNAHATCRPPASAEGDRAE